MISLSITSNAADVLRNLHAMPDRMARQLARAMDKQNELTIAQIQRNRLSQRGPESLGVVTGRLRRSIRRSNAIVTGNTISSSIGTNVVYAGPHEFGFRGLVKVKEHVRRAGGFAAKKNTKSGGATSGAAYVTVRAHDRNLNIPARRPIDRGIRDRADAYGRAFSDAIIAAWNGRNL